MCVPVHVSVMSCLCEEPIKTSRTRLVSTIMLTGIMFRQGRGCTEHVVTVGSGCMTSCVGGQGHAQGLSTIINQVLQITVPNGANCVHVRKVKELHPTLISGDLPEDGVLSSANPYGIFHWSVSGCGKTRFGRDFTKAGVLFEPGYVQTSTTSTTSTSTTSTTSTKTTTVTGGSTDVDGASVGGTTTTSTTSTSTTSTSTTTTTTLFVLVSEIEIGIKTTSTDTNAQIANTLKNDQNFVDGVETSVATGLSSLTVTVHKDQVDVTDITVSDAAAGDGSSSSSAGTVAKDVDVDFTVGFGTGGGGSYPSPSEIDLLKDKGTTGTPESGAFAAQTKAALTTALSAKPAAVVAEVTDVGVTHSTTTTTTTTTTVTQPDMPHPVKSSMTFEMGATSRRRGLSPFYSEQGDELRTLTGGSSTSFGSTCGVALGGTSDLFLLEPPPAGADPQCVNFVAAVRSALCAALNVRAQQAFPSWQCYGKVGGLLRVLSWSK